MSYGINVDVSIPAGHRDIRLTPDDTERIAMGMRDEFLLPIHSDWVQIKKLPPAGMYRITIVNEDVMARVQPFEDAPGWTSINDPVLLGRELDGTPYSTRLDRVMLVTGNQGSGKTSLIHTSWAHVTKCADAVLMVAGAEKLFETLNGWLLPYDNVDLPIPFDWIANGYQDTVEFLAALMRIIRWRQKQGFDKRRWPHIVAWVDEASFPLTRGDVTAVYEGKPLNCSELASMVCKTGRTAQVWLGLATQRGTVDELGIKGGLIRSLVKTAVAFSSRDWAEIGRAMGDYKLQVPSNIGECWVDARDLHALPTRIKSLYIQTDDPLQPVLHNGPRLSDVSWARRDYHVPLDPGSAEAAGPLYAKRHTRMGPELVAYLTDDSVPEAGVGAAGGIEAELAELRALGVLGNGSARPPGFGDAGVTSLVDRRPRKDRVLEILRTADGPLERSAILAALAAQGDDCHPNTLTNLLGEMRDRHHTAAQPDGGTGWAAL